MSAGKGAAFRALHEPGRPPFLIPNPWDGGSAVVLEQLGFRALATTSSGFAFTLGRRDGGVTLEQLCEHVRLLDSVSGLPVSADAENGFGPEPADAARAVSAVAAAGAAGGSIEDWDAERGIYARERAAERIAAAAEAACAAAGPFVLTARAENHIRGNPDLADTIARLQAYEEAGADVLYAPGLARTEDIRAVCSSVSRPVNVLARPGLTFAAVTAAGAQRVSVGGALTWVAARALREAAQTLAETGEFALFEGATPPLH